MVLATLYTFLSETLQNMTQQQNTKGEAVDQVMLRGFVELGERARMAEDSHNYNEALSLYSAALKMAKDHLLEYPGIEDVISNFHSRLRNLRGLLATSQPVSAISTTIGKPAARGGKGRGGRGRGEGVSQQHETFEDLRVEGATPGFSFDDICGLEVAKRALLEMVVLPSKNPKLFTGLRAPPRGLLLFGPPGNGKTMLAKATAAQCGCPFYSCTASSLTSKWHGEDEKKVKALFEEARRVAPSVLFIDEADAILGKRGGNSEHEASRRAKNEFLVQMDGIISGDDERRVVVIAATNRPMDLDEAVLRRLPKRIYLPLPDEKTRKVMLMSMLYCSGTKYDISSAEFGMLVSHLEGYSHADISNLCKESAISTMRSINPDKLARMNPDQVPAITLDDFEHAMELIRPSVSVEGLQSLEDWNDNFGVKI